MNDKEGRKWLLQKLYNNGIKYIAYSPFYGGYVGVKETPRISAKGEVINDITTVITLHGILPDFNKPNYLDIGKYLGIIDWNKVAVDTPIKIRHNDGVVANRHFSKFSGGMVYYFDNGRTSWSETGETKIMPKYVRLAGGDDEN